MHNAMKKKWNSRRERMRKKRKRRKRRRRRMSSKKVRHTSRDRIVCGKPSDRGEWRYCVHTARQNDKMNTVNIRKRNLWEKMEQTNHTYNLLWIHSFCRCQCRVARTHAIHKHDYHTFRCMYGEHIEPAAVCVVVWPSKQTKTTHTATSMHV